MMVRKVGKQQVSKYTFNEIRLIEKTNLRIKIEDYSKS